MTSLNQQYGRLLKLFAVAGLVAFSPQVFAVGTDAGTPINNSAFVDYEVNGQTQSQIQADAPQFLVDRIVSFTITAQDSLNTDVAPNEQDAVTLFTLTNTGNGTLDFSLSAVNLASGANVNSSVDDADMDTVFEFLVANGGGVPTSGDLSFVDGLVEDGSVQIAVLADAPITLTDGQFAHITLTATAGDSPAAADGFEGAELAPSATDDPTLVDNVFDPAVDNTTNAQASANDGYAVVAADLTVTKSAEVISDPISPGPDFFAIPGAIVEYTLLLSNAGTATAENVSISDALEAALLFETANLPAGTGNVSIDINGTTTYCIADAADANGDGCTLTGGDTLTIAGIDESSGPIVPLDVGANDVTITFRAMIDDSP